MISTSAHPRTAALLGQVPNFGTSFGTGIVATPSTNRPTIPYFYCSHIHCPPHANILFSLASMTTGTGEASVGQLLLREALRFPLFASCCRDIYCNPETCATPCSSSSRPSSLLILTCLIKIALRPSRPSIACKDIGRKGC